MKALVYLGPHEKAVEDRAKPTIDAPTDAIVKVTRTTICGTDLGDVPSCQPGRILGHEGAGVGVIDAVGSAVTAFKTGRSVDLMRPARFAHGMFVGQHGSWNRNVLGGYTVIFIPFDRSKPAGAPIDALTGFVNAKSQAYGRRVGVALDSRGALLVADDVGNEIWRVSGAH